MISSDDMSRAVFDRELGRTSTTVLLASQEADDEGLLGGHDQRDAGRLVREDIVSVRLTEKNKGDCIQLVVSTDSFGRRKNQHFSKVAFLIAYYHALTRGSGSMWNCQSPLNNLFQ